jgi:hypothetical protein
VNNRGQILGSSGAYHDNPHAVLWTKRSRAGPGLKDLPYRQREVVNVIGACLLLLRVERTGIEPVTSDLQIPGFEPRLGQVRSVNAMLRWLCEVEIGYSGHGSGHVF